MKIQKPDMGVTKMYTSVLIHMLSLKFDSSKTAGGKDNAATIMLLQAIIDIPKYK